MIETISDAVKLLRAHPDACNRSICELCDHESDLVDLLGVCRRLLNVALTAPPGCDIWPTAEEDEVRALLADEQPDTVGP